VAKEVKAMPNTNIFREAKHLLDTKKGSEMNEEERSTMTAALIPFSIKGVPLPENITIMEGLEELAKIVEEAE